MTHAGTFAGRLLLGSAVVAFSMISMAQSSGTAAGKEGSMQEPPDQTQSDSMKHSAGTSMSKDQTFVRAAAQGGMAEVELGKLAEEKASSEDVKKFGERMVNDHSKANDQLKQIASDQGITLPQHLDAKDRALKLRLSKLSGATFDHVYMENMVKGHKQDIADFQKESSSGNDAAVRQFASETLPTLQSHLQEAESIAPNTKMSRNNMSSNGMQK